MANTQAELKVLEDAGLTANEAKVYSALLRLGPSPVGDVVKESGVYSANVYGALKRLSDKGLANGIDRNKKKFFEANDPVMLLNLVKIKEDALNALVPRLSNEYEKSRTRMEIRLLTGKEGFKVALEDVVKERKDWLIIGGTGKSVVVLPEYSYQIQARRERAKIPSRFLVYDTPLARKRGAEWQKLKHTQVRYMRKGLESPLTIYVYGDKSAILLWSEDNPLTFVVNDPRIAEGFRKYFEFLWELFKPGPADRTV